MVSHVRIECASNDFRKLIIKKFERAGRIFENIGEFVEEIKKAPVCTSSKQTKIEGKPKRTNPRAEYMGHCMRSPSKGGKGLGMKECSEMWKQEPR